MVASCHVKDALSAMTMLFSFLEIKKKLKQASNNWWLLKYKNGADKNIILGFAMMLLLAVDNLIYIPIHYRGDNGDPLSFMILGAIELICLIIFFLYYQNWGNKALTFCAGVLLVLSFGFEMVEAIRLLSAADITLTLDTFYNLMKKVLNTLLAVQALLFVFALNPSVRVKD